jgi:endonuclease/exonuclease/phosphatase family metal-dependent hydrolase
MKLKVMTYNILYGAGVEPSDREVSESSTNGKCMGDRLDRVIKVIKHVDPDVLGIEEANSWNKNDQAIAKKVASELGMNYYLAVSGRSGFHVAVYSKLPIASAKGFPDEFTRSALQAELTLPDGRPFHVFVQHFNLRRNPEGQLEEIRCLASKMRPYAFDLGVMMGDANFSYGKHESQSKALKASGFVIAPQIGLLIDQIWTTRPLEGRVLDSPKIPTELIDGTSDHMPTVVIVDIPPAKASNCN